VTDLVACEWYQQLIEDLKDAITECEFTARWTIIEGYHMIGKRILEEYPNFERGQIYGEEIASRVSQSLGKSKRTIERAIQFARQYPDLNLLPEGKNTSWHQICNKYLPKPSDKTGKPQTEEYAVCPRCGSEVKLILRCRCGQEFEITKDKIRKQ